MNQAFEQSVLRNLHRIGNQELTGYLQRFFHEKNLMKNAWDALSAALIILNQNNHIVNYNRAFYSFFPRKKSDPTGRSIIDYCNNHDLKLGLEKLLGEGHISEYMEINVFDKASKDYFISLYHFEYESFPFTDQKKNLYKVLVISDMTDWKNKNLAEDQKKSIDSLQTLTTGIAHEIKNPLTAIDLHLQLIKRFIGTEESKTENKLNRWVDVVSEEIKRLESIVNDFLFTFRPIKPIKTPQKLNTIISEVIEFFTPQCQKKDIQIKTDFDPKMKTFLFDKNQIKQVLINLLHNSIEAIEENPQIDGKGLITIITKDNYQTVEAVITDNGIGISAHKVTDIFKPYYTTKKTGTGLGLSIVSRIIHEHQGDIILNTDYQEGTQFFLEFSRLPSIHKNKQIPHQP